MPYLKFNMPGLTPATTIAPTWETLPSAGMIREEPLFPGLQGDLNVEDDSMDEDKRVEEPTTGKKRRVS